MAKVKTNPDHDSAVAVFWIRNPWEPDLAEAYEQVIISQDRDLSALRIRLPDGPEIVVFGPPCGGETQIFLHPENDELRENPDALITNRELMRRNAEPIA